MQSGMGALRATQAATWLAARYPLRALVSVGFAGGLHADLDTGHGLLVTTLQEASCASSAPHPIQPDARLSHIAAMALAQAALVGHSGGLVSVPEVMALATAKQHLGQQSGALAVDMESYSLGQVARQCQLPFLTLRVIFDPVNEDMTFPVSQCMTAAGTLRAAALGAYLMRQPRFLTHLPRWWWQAQHAGRQLQRWMQYFFILLSQGA